MRRYADGLPVPKGSTDTSGLQYLRARYDDPAVGRVISRDPYVNGSAGRPLFRDAGLIGSALNHSP